MYDNLTTYGYLLVYGRKHEKHIKFLRACFRKKVILNHVVVGQLSNFVT
jgi:hypothetical protein